MLDSFLCFRHFEVDKSNADDASKIFSVPDFVGDACKAIASRVRGTVAGVQFDDFHKVIYIYIYIPFWCLLSPSPLRVFSKLLNALLFSLSLSPSPSQNSARIIRSSVFGLNERGKVKDRFVFVTNNLIITSIDIQSVEPVDQRTRDALQKSVQLAIEITTNSQEATAR